MIAERTQARRIIDLRPHPLNPRGPVTPDDAAELVESIREQGILQPLVVTPDGTVLIGHRRLVAAQLAGLTEVTVVVREASTEADQLAVMLVENIQRQDLTPLQEARAFQRLIDSGLSRADVARRCGIPGNQIQSRLAVLKLDGEVQELVGRRELPLTLVPVLAKVGDPVYQRRLAAMAATRRATVEHIESLVERGKESGSIKPAKSDAGKPPNTPKASNQPGRREVVALLKASPERTLTFADLLAAFDGACSVCSQCGMADLDVACRSCPGPQFVKRLAKGSH
jgi:ParB family chromosome partitioning protein